MNSFKKDEKPFLTKRMTSSDKLGDPGTIVGFQAHVARCRNGEVQHTDFGISAPKSTASRVAPDARHLGRRKSSLGAKGLPMLRKPKAGHGDGLGLSEEEKEQLRRAAFDRADLNRDQVLEATEIKHAYESCGLEITDEEIWEAMESCHQAYNVLHPGDISAESNGNAKSPHGRVVADWEHFLAYPDLLPDAFIQATYRMLMSTHGNSHPGTPVSKKSSKRRTSGFTYVSQNSERKPVRHAVLIALDCYADERIPISYHCMSDARALGEVLETLGYSVELLSNSPDDSCQPKRTTILNALTCSRDRDADMLLVYFTGYWATAHLHETGAAANKLSHFCICYDTSLDFNRRNVLTLDDIKKTVAGSQHTMDTMIVIDGLQPAFIPGCRGEGYSVVSYMGEDILALSSLKHRSLLSYYLCKGLRGAGQEEGGGPITMASLHQYVGAKLSKYTYAALPSIPGGAEKQIICTQILESRLDGSHPRQQQQAQPCTFFLECAFPAVIAPEEFHIRVTDTIKAGDSLKGVTVQDVKQCKTVEFLLSCAIQDVQPIQHKFKTEIEKVADENTWVRIRTAAVTENMDSLRWSLSASFGLDNVSPAVLLTIHTASPESVGKLRTRYLNRLLKEWCGFPILWMRLRTKVVCNGSDYDRLKLDIRCRTGAFLRDKEKDESQKGKLLVGPAVYIYNVEKDISVPWRPQPLPLRKFNRLSEAQFERLFTGLPILVHWCGKLEEPNATASMGQMRTHKALCEVFTEPTFKNKINFFQYEVDSVVYPRYVVEGLAKYNTRRLEDEVSILYLKYDRAVTLDISSSASRISAEKIRELCNDFLQGKAKRLHDGTMKALRPPGLPEDHPGTVVIGINHFDRLAMDVDKDVLVLYWNVDCPEHQQDRLQRAAAAFAKLGKLFSDQPDDVHLPSLVVMSDDNNESFFFPEHHPDAKVHIAPQLPPEGRIRSPVAGRRLVSSAEMRRPQSPNDPPRQNGDKPPFTIRLFPANEEAAWRVRRGEFVDYWPDVFETAVKTCKTFFAAANGPGPLCTFLERSTDWAPRVPLRIAIDEETRLLQDKDKLPDIFKGL